MSTKHPHLPAGEPAGAAAAPGCPAAVPAATAPIASWVAAASAEVKRAVMDGQLSMPNNSLDTFCISTL